MIRGRCLIHHVSLPGGWALSLTLACTPTSNEVRSAALATSAASARSAVPATSALPVEIVTPAPTASVVPEAAPAEKLHVWFNADMETRVYVLEHMTIIMRSVPTDPAPSIFVPAHVLGEQRVREEPTFFSGLETAPLPVGGDDAPWVTGGGISSLGGDWPRRGRLLLGGDYDLQAYEWNGSRWRRSKSCPMPAWFQPGRGDMAPFVRLRGNACLYAKREYPNPEGRVTFVLDAAGAKLAPIQPVPAPASCKTKGVRVVGAVRFVGGVSPRGVLVSEGDDCTTGKPAVEVWPANSKQSTVFASPCPHSPDSSPELFEAPDGTLYLLHEGECFLRYDGTTLTDASPPNDPVRDLAFAPDGSLIAAGKHLWTRRGPDLWERIEAGPCETETLQHVLQTPQGELWLSCDKVVRRRGGEWERIGLPEGVEGAASELTLAHDGRVIVQVGNALLMSAPPSERVDAVVRRNPP